MFYLRSHTLKDDDGKTAITICLQCLWLGEQQMGGAVR